ncbi:FAD-binding and (Fe-S)-binding domain-containing protein [Jeongeupia wiesaeckerbachi]|uniref:FAD-binding and (Fe-S)-binding domain-containing protein n=1 Tax=Jeongeupia wiesaeckerbachi TaxID=3051218 RepID=UPI003D804B41
MNLPPAHHAFYLALQRELPAARLITDPARTLAYGTDASFYRLVPQIVVRIENEAEVRLLLREAHAHRVAVTFRAAGTSLSGQAVSDSVLVMLGDGWNGRQVLDDGARIRLQPGVIGQHANDALAPWGRKIGPDPASIATAKIGGIAANNSSGMCCGTRHNGYHTLSAIRLILADGSVLDTADADSVAAFRDSHAALLDGLATLAAEIRARPALESKIRHKYRLKNTTGYGINALVDFSDPVDMLAHLMIGSEGTLGFISSITYDTVVDLPNKASALIVFHNLDACCRAVTALREQALCDAVELIDARSMRTVRHMRGLPDFMYDEIPDGAAALLIETRADDKDALTQRCSTIGALVAAYTPQADSGFHTDPAVTNAYWSVRKGLFPAVGAARPVGTTVVIEDVAFPIEHLADGVRRLGELFDRHGYDEALLFGHALEGNLHFVFTPSFDSDAETQRYSDFMDAVAALVAVEYGGSLKAEHGTGRNMAPFVRQEWGDDAFAIMQTIKRLFDPAGVLNPDVIISSNERIHLQDLKAMPAADELVDRCIECGFCEPVCPSNGLTLTPRQRIVLWRAISAARRRGDDSPTVQAWERDYRHAGIDSCAATGMCATRCPVGINTGTLMQKLKGPNRYRKAGAWVATHMKLATGAARLGLAGWHATRTLLGDDGARKLNRAARKIIPLVPAVPAAMPRPARPLPAPGQTGRPVVYFVSCVNRTLAEGDGKDSVASSALSLFGKSGWHAIYPPGLNTLCCGQPFASANAEDAANTAGNATNTALLAASNNGEIPVYIDNGPCALRLIEAQRAGLVDARLRLYDAASFLDEHVAPRLAIAKPLAELALHVPCSATKLGAADALRALAQRCSDKPIGTGVACCGFAGSKGFTLPELNANSLGQLAPEARACAHGVSMSQTCQIGLSSHTGSRYHSIEALLDQLSTPLAGPDQGR